MATTDQKLKVVQTWIFLQGMLLTLLTAYLIVLSVWLVPFFPMNYETGDETDANTAAIAKLQNNFTNTEGQVDNNTAIILVLQQLTVNHTEENNDMNSTINALQQEISVLQNETAELNATVINLQRQVNRMTLDMGITTLADIIRRLDDLDGGGVTAPPHGVFSSVRPPLLPPPRAKIDNHHLRLLELEVFREKIMDIVKEGSHYMKGRICNLAKAIGDIKGQVVQFHGHAKALTDHATTHRDRLDTLTGEVHHLEQRMDDTETKINRTKKELIHRERRAIDLFREQDDLRAAALEKQRILLETRAGKLQCSVKRLNATMHKKLGMQATVLHNRASKVAKDAAAHTEGVGKELTKLVTLTKHSAGAMLSETNRTLNKAMADVTMRVEKEKKLRQNQYLHLCDRIDNVTEHTGGEINHNKHQIAQAKSKIGNLSNAITRIRKDNAKHGEDIAIITRGLRDHELKSIQFRQESTATDLDLRNKTCLLRKKVREHWERLTRHGVRLNNTDHSVDNLSRETLGKILEVEGALISNILELSRGQNNISDSIAQVQRQYAQLRQNLGDRLIRNLENDFGGTTTPAVALKRLDLNPTRDDVDDAAAAPPPIAEKKKE